MEPSSAQIETLADLLKSEGAAVIHLPYTQAFQRIYTEFKRLASIDLDKHEFWELILQVRSSAAIREQSSSTQVESPIPSPSPGLSGFPAHLRPTPDTQWLLFGPDDASGPLQAAFTAAWQPGMDEALNKKREQLLADIARSEFGDAEQKVAYVLQRFPETRESSVMLCIRYWQRFNADVFERWGLDDLDFLFELDRWETIGRVRREIQNKLQLFRGLESTAQYRLLYQKNLQDYLTAHKGVIP